MRTRLTIAAMLICGLAYGASRVPDTLEPMSETYSVTSQTYHRGGWHSGTNPANVYAFTLVDGMAYYNTSTSNLWVYSTAGGWELLSIPSVATNLTLDAIIGTMTLNSIPVGDGTHLVLKTPAQVRTVLALGTAATNPATAFATAAQGIAATNAQATANVLKTNTATKAVGIAATNHHARTDNPHQVTTGQIGALDKTGYGNNKFLITDGLGEATTVDRSLYATNAGAAGGGYYAMSGGVWRVFSPGAGGTGTVDSVARALGTYGSNQVIVVRGGTNGLRQTATNQAAVYTRAQVAAVTNAAAGTTNAFKGDGSKVNIAADIGKARTAYTHATSAHGIATTGPETGFQGGISATTEAGGAIGASATSTLGGAVGSGANAQQGGAVGLSATATQGGAVGSSASATLGGAVGFAAGASSGFSGGAYAISGVNAVQLGAGTNVIPFSLQIYGNQLLSSNGVIPAARLANAITNNKPNSVTGGMLQKRVVTGDKLSPTNAGTSGYVLKGAVTAGGTNLYWGADATGGGSAVVTNIMSLTVLDPTNNVQPYYVAALPWASTLTRVYTEVNGGAVTGTVNICYAHETNATANFKQIDAARNLIVAGNADVSFQTSAIPAATKVGFRIANLSAYLITNQVQVTITRTVP